MSIHELYESLTPAGFFTLAVGLFLLAGLFLGWCMWWWTSRRYQQSQFDHNSIEGDVVRLKSENRALEDQLQQRETAADSNMDSAGNTGVAPAVSDSESDAGSKRVGADESSSSNLMPSAASAVDWASLEGVDPQVAEELNRLGIKNIEQLEALSPEEREIVEAKLSFDGKQWEWTSLANWKTAAAGAAGLYAAVNHDESADAADTAGIADVAVERDQPVVGDASIRIDPGHGVPAMVEDGAGSRAGLAGHLSMIDGVDPKLVDELSWMGISSVDQLESLSESQREQLDAKLSESGVKWDWGWLAQWRAQCKTQCNTQGATISATSGVAESAASSVTQDVSTSVDEISSLGWAAPNHAGSDCSGDVGANASRDDNGPMTVRMTGVAGSSGSGAKENLGADAPRTFDPNQLPVFATGVPAVKDDLTLLDGIDEPQATELHRMGIHNFDQLHDLSDFDRERLQSWFRSQGWDLDMGQWRIASEGNTENPTTEDIQRKAFEVYQHRDYHNLGGGEQTDWEQAEWDLRGNPSFGYGIPHDVDDFSVTLTGVTPEARDELYRMGLYNVHQANLLDYDARRLLTRWFAGPRFGVDLTMAFGWLSSLESVPHDRDYGHVFTNRPDQIDDLSDIDGIGPATERELNRIGIYQFSQVAAWTEENTQAVTETLGLGNRIADDLWVVQAQRLASDQS